MNCRNVELAETAGSVKEKLVILLSKQDSKNIFLNNFPTAFLFCFVKDSTYKIVAYLFFSTFSLPKKTELCIFDLSF